MKTILPLLFIFSLLISCSNTEKLDYKIPQKVIIAGKVLNTEPGNSDVKLYVNRPGLGQTELYAKADSLGNFQTFFETYTPTDVWLQYKMNVLVLTHPGDSIFVEFDGKPNKRPAILETIKFSGDEAKKNKDAAKFQYMYFSNPLYYDWDAKHKAAKDYDIDEYVQYLDTLKQKIDSLYNSFVKTVSPDEEVKTWAKTYIEQDYFDALSMYPFQHQRANNLSSNEWQVPDSYFDSLLTRLPITRDMFISGYALLGFINRFHYDYSYRKTWNEESLNKYKNEQGYFINVLPEIRDSLNVFGVIKYTQDSLLRQMVLTELFHQQLKRSDIALYEKYKAVVDEYIREPFLKEPLFEMYMEVKERIENPKIATNAYLEKLENTSAKQVFDTIVQQNKGKVIYLDCWATWCGPCKAEMPHSKKLMEQLEGKEVAFVYVCVDSEEKLWKASLAEFQLGGQHYHLSKQQSTEWRKVFEVNGIPHYFLMDKSGVIVEKGSHLRPNSVTEKIEKLL